MPCRSSRFKEERSLQKCKPCLDCGVLNRSHKANCSSTSNALCGDCLPGSVLRLAPAKAFLLLLRTKTHTCVCVCVCFPSFSRYYRKTKLSGFQDMECIPCGDPPPPHEPHCKHFNVALTTGSTSHPRLSSRLEAKMAAVRAACVRRNSCRQKQQI